jgi:hypothetical protein
MVWFSFHGELILIDTVLQQSLKRPDASFKIAEDQIPNPAPAWLRFLPDNSPYPNVVVEIAVNNEAPNKLINDAHRYFAANTSVQVWVGVKVWLQGREVLGWMGRTGSQWSWGYHSHWDVLSSQSSFYRQSGQFGV